MHCPRCQDQVLDVKERDGVTIDVCHRCHGLWLDRGELEKLIARADDDRRDDERRYESERRYDDGRRYDGDRRDGDKYRYPSDRDHQRYPRKRSWFENLGDLFD